EMLAFLPPVQRERAGFIERLGHYFSSPAPRRAFFILAGKKLLKPIFEILGDPMRSDAQGHVTDIPFALYWIELLARLGLVRQIPSASRVLAQLFNECHDQGIWSPKSLRAMPKAASPLTAHYFPLEGPGKSPAQRQTDTTFRLGLIARLMGIPVANLIMQVVARAERRAEGVLSAELLRPTLPGWRRAKERAALELRVAGEAPAEAGPILSGTVAGDLPTVLLIDDVQAVIVAGS